MPVARKPDSQEFREFLQELANQDWIRRTDRHYWPGFLFHHTHLENAVNILESGYLLSRKMAEESGRLFHSSGSTSVLAHTDPYVKTCARFYFRPLTPTQFHVEGIRSQITLQKSPYRDAHCPVMVFLLFDAAEILTRAAVEFSDGNLASTMKANRYQTAAELQALPWKKIYHQGSFDTSRYRDITFHKNAEVIVPDRVGLDALQYIWCRSSAEKETLTHMLPDEIREKYQQRIFSSSRYRLFYGEHTYIERVRLNSNTVRVEFSPDTKSPGPFELLVEIDVPDFENLETDGFIVEPNYSSFTIALPRSASNYEIRIYLDGHLAYANHFEEIDIPF